MIENLEEKLLGNIPIKRFELVKLIDSWGRIEDDEDDIENKGNIQNECYPLEKLNTSFIEDFSNLFKDSLYNGDLSKWDISSGQNFKEMFMNTNNLYFDLTTWVKQLKENKNNFDNIDLRYVFADSSISEKYCDEKGQTAGYFKSNKFWFEKNFDKILKIDLETNIKNIENDINNNKNEFNNFIKENKIINTSKEYKLIEKKLNETQEPLLKELEKLNNELENLNNENINRSR